MAETFITIQAAAKMLGVTPLTLRNWDKNGKLPTTRHPMSNYRIYRKEDLERLIREIETGSAQIKAKKRKPLRRKLEVRSIRDD